MHRTHTLQWRRSLAVLCIIVAGHSAAWGQDVGRRVESPATDARRAPVRVGEIDVERSRTYVRIGATGVGHEHGAVGRLVGGNIQLGSPTNAGKLVFDMASFVAETPESRKVVGLSGEIDASTQAKVTENMLGKDVLDVKKYPQASFEITSAMPLSAPRPGEPPVYQLEGRFSMHGKERPLRINAQAESIGGLVRLRGRFSVLQTDYGIKPYTKLLGAVGVADELLIYGDIWVQPAPANARNTSR